MHPALTEFSLTVKIPVQWGELDAYGHVNNTVFFRYFESLRVLYLVRSGFAESYERDKVGAILHSTECRFRRALRGGSASLYSVARSDNWTGGHVRRPPVGAAG
jgi:acyl-CoA thioesterase FadM